MRSTSVLLAIIAGLAISAVVAGVVLAAPGDITTVAGGFIGDGGPATSASLNGPLGVAVDASGNLFITDRLNHRVRRVDAATGIITTVAGDGGSGFSGDGGPATSASLSFPEGVAVDASGNLFIADAGNSRIGRVDAATGIITTVAGVGAGGFSGDGGPATSASLFFPEGVAVDALGNLFIADTSNNRVRRVDAATGIITTVAGDGASGFSGDGGPATSASLNSPRGVAVDASGNLFIADFSNDRVRRVDAVTGTITTVAGGVFGDGGPATGASLNRPFEVAADGSGNLLIADFSNNRVRRVDAATGIITTVAGDGAFGFSGDGGPATSASLGFPSGVAVDSSGNLFIADFSNRRIRRVDAATGIITTVAGDGGSRFSGDGGPATSASFSSPRGVAVDASGNLFIAVRGNSRVRRVDAATGIITTVAGDGSLGFSGDGGPATSASLSSPSGVAVDASGNLFIADFSNSRIRRVDAATGIITTVAGNGSSGFSGDGGPATSASLCGVLTLWRWTPRATSSSPRSPTTTSAEWTPPPGSSPRWRATAAPRPAPTSVLPAVWRWTPWATSSSLIRATTASGRWRECLPRHRLLALPQLQLPALLQLLFPSQIQPEPPYPPPPSWA
jgi:sugar lactone lactonase YvrE